MRKTTKVIALVGLLGSLSLTGCTINIGSPNNGGNHMMEQNNSRYSNTDVMFAQMMIPHHQQAVDMGTLAETRASNPEVRALAAKIKSEQTPEITQMETWLTAANAGMTMGHEMHMGGMLSENEFAALEATTGDMFDKLYLEGMIAHHEGAIEMAQMVLTSNNAEAKELGEAIVASQSEQIAYMKALLKTLA